MLPLTRSRNRARFFGIPFSPSTLFEGGTVSGAWYDPSDLSTMFDTSAGTTPVAMPGQGAAVPVGAMLDKRATGYSLFFGGAGDCLTTPNSADLQLGSTYTVECWVYRTGTGTNIRIFSDGSINVNNVDIYIATGTNFITFFGGFTSSAYVLPLNTWVHIALVVTAGIPALYANGIAQTLSGTLTGVNSTATTTRIIGGVFSLGAYSFVGNIFNLRVVKGTAVYTGNFTPPTAPLSPITGTSLLTCGTTWSGNPAITTVGNTRVDGLNPFTASPVGNHAISFNNTTARPELRARVNLLTYSEEFNSGAWGKVAVTVTANTTVAPDGTTTADTLTETTALNYHSTYSTNTVAAGQSITGSFAIKKNSVRYAQINYGGTAAGRWIQCVIDLDTGLITQSSAGAGGTLVSSSSTSLGDGWYRVSLTGSVVTDTTTYFYVGTVSSATPSFNTYGLEDRVGSTSNSIYIWGADLRPANIGANVPAYQRIADANTYDTNGFPLYLRFDGIDDSMYTPANLNLSGTDKVSVFAGVRKLSDAAIGFITELSANANTTNGTFQLRGPDSAADYYATLRGTSLAQYIPVTFAAPISNVVSSIMNIAGASISTELIPRVNGVVEQDSPTGTAGTGNFGTHPLFIGSRNNGSFWFNGHLYSLVIAGSAVSAGNISATEQWVAGKTGIQI